MLEEVVKSVAQSVPVVGGLRDVKFQNREWLAGGKTRSDMNGGGEWEESTTIASHEGILLQVVDIRFELSMTEGHSRGEGVNRFVLGFVVESGNLSLENCAGGVSPMDSRAASSWEWGGKSGGELGECGEHGVDSQAQSSQLNRLPFDVSWHDWLVVTFHS